MMQGLICLLHVGRVLRPAVGLPSLLSKEPLFFVDDDGQSLCNQKVIPSPSFAVKKNDAVVLAEKKQCISHLTTMLVSHGKIFTPPSNWPRLLAQVLILLK